MSPQHQVAPVAQSIKINDFRGLSGAGNRIRTRDPLITNQVLYQLSYTGIGKAFSIGLPWAATAFGVSGALFGKGCELLFSRDGRRRIVNCLLRRCLNPFHISRRNAAQICLRAL